MPDISPVTAGASNEHAIDLTNQRKAFYGASRLWLFYYDYSDEMLVYTSTLDGVTWDTHTDIALCEEEGEGFSLWWDGTYVHYCRAAQDEDPNELRYRRGTPNASGIINWLDEATAFVATASEDRIQDPGICLDSSGRAILCYVYKDTSEGTFIPWITKSGNSDGTWGSTPAGFPYQVSAISRCYAIVLPLLADDAFVAIYGIGAGTVKLKLYDGDSWGSEHTTMLAIENIDYLSAVVTSDNIVHMVFLEDIDDDIQYTSFNGTDWAAEEVVYAGASATMAPVLAKLPNNNLVCFWLGDPSANHVYYKRRINGVWGASPTDWLTEANIVGNDRISCAYQQGELYVPVVWLTGAESPYSVRFAGLMGSVISPLPCFRPGG